MPEPPVIVLASWPSLDLTTVGTTVIFTAPDDCKILGLVFRSPENDALTAWPVVGYGSNEDADNMREPARLIGLEAAEDVYHFPMIGKGVRMALGHELAVSVTEAAVASTLTASIDVLGYMDEVA